MAGVNCSWGFAIVTPVAAIDLKYSIIGAFVSRVVVCSLRVITALPFGQTHPVRQADSLVAIQSKFFQSSGQLTPFIDLALDSGGKEEKPQDQECLHVDWEARPLC